MIFSDNTRIDRVNADGDVGGPVLVVRDLTIEFPAAGGSTLTPVNGIDLDIMPREIVAIVGESGSGKSLTARSLLRLVPEPGRIARGRIELQGRDLANLSEREMRRVRGRRIAMVFQDPMTALNPVQSIGAQIAEIIRLHDNVQSSDLRRRVIALLERVGIADAANRARNYPHEFSGGMRQRSVIAMAVANNPAVLIADEPTTALDVTVQDQIMGLLRDLNRTAGTSILLISHNLAVVASLCSRIIVMYAGRVVEEAPTATVFAAPEHPYTWSLLRSVPRVDKVAERLRTIEGQPPNPQDMPTGCKFHPRCAFAEPRCAISEPPLEEIATNHRVRCWVMMRNARSGQR
ncbi:MAG: ABC transporter ATP-binding protein [Mesorhizobium sp.]|uniref:ABC transporter ATP-binding protein n=1 Tax=Mesorhizobium sp. TaxID=1871066 RepID=UPI000FE854B7|nr:ABC transporter ATP-binding protein [Mesorhizobium sp.]RWI50268.1 MAG: ABC transporter ATP-binding protein [Mesorhizobium sp.]